MLRKASGRERGSAALRAGELGGELDRALAQRDHARARRGIERILELLDLGDAVEPPRVARALAHDAEALRALEHDVEAAIRELLRIA